MAGRERSGHWAVRGKVQYKRNRAADKSDASALRVITFEAGPATARVFGSVAEAAEQLVGPAPELSMGGQE